jgi:S1-C subfamily serine protease
VSFLDVLLVGSLLGAVVLGYRRGALLQLCSYAGLAAGLVVGAWLAPRMATLVSSEPARAGVALGTLFLGGALGNAIGWLVGSKIRTRTHGGRLRRPDAVGGSLVSAAAMLLATWFLALNLVNGPFPTLSRQIRGSAVIGAIDAVMPAPPSLVGQVRRVLDHLGFPDVFAGLPPEPAAPVPPPTDRQVLRAGRAGSRATVQIVGAGCGGLLEGSGFVAGPDLVVTNAHVIAGIDGPEVLSGDRRLPAVVVAFDPDLDLAVLQVAELGIAPMSLAPGIAPRGAVGATIGYPGGGPRTIGEAAVRRALEAVGRDIYGGEPVERRVYELQSKVRPGSSGGPFVLADGRVAGVVFAASTADDRVGYAIASVELPPILAVASAGMRADTGVCLA